MYRQYVWLLVAVLSGLVIATQSLFISISFVAFILIILVLIFTPIATLSLLLVLAPLRTLIATEANLHVPFDIGQIMFVAFIVGWIASCVVRDKSWLGLRYNPIVLPILLFMLVGGLTVFTALSLHVWLLEWLKWLLILVMVLVIPSFNDNDLPQWLGFILVMSAVANALVGLYIFFGGSGADHLLINGRFFRAFGTFGQPNPFGGFMGLMLPIAIQT